MSADVRELYAVLRFIRPLHLLSARAVTAALDGEQITLGIRALLETVEQGGPAPVPAIGRALSMPRQVIQRLVDQAGALGLVVATPNPAHKRSPIVALTAAGQATFARIHAAELRTLDPIAAGLDAQDVAAAVRVLDALTAGVTRVTQDIAPTSEEPT